MIRKRIKERSERVKERWKNSKSILNDHDKPSERVNESEENINDTDNMHMNEVTPQQNGNTKWSESHADKDDTQKMNEDFDYLTDICRDKKFNKNELSIILKVIKLEMQPLIYLLLFIKGILTWSNTAFTSISFVVLLYFAYINVVKYLFGFMFIIISLLMFLMKIYPENTIFVMALFVGAVTPIDGGIDDNVEQNKDDQTNLRRWQLLQRARRVKRRVQKGFVKLGEFQYLLYELSIYIGKLRTIYFYKDDNCGKVVCIMNLMIGLFFILLPFRVNYVIAVVLVFSLKPLLFIKKVKGNKKGEFVKKLNSAFKSVVPDIPKVQFNDNL